MKHTYKAIEVSTPDNLHLVERPVPESGPGQVRVRGGSMRSLSFPTAASAFGIAPHLTKERIHMITLF